ncbi:MAG: hypothetical protein DME07_13335 [Candidatus Rokuibacteriota bacterium]|nr:MAG: hypothetical protein DME07_13335 [Candidatus Rokubacteria bacterium]
MVITAGNVAASARLNDSSTARAIWDALPIEAKGETWGDEIYFDIGLTAEPEAAMSWARSSAMRQSSSRCARAHAFP